MSLPSGYKPFRARNSLAEQPKRARKMRLKCAASLKPQPNAISVIVRPRGQGRRCRAWRHPAADSRSSC